MPTPISVHFSRHCGHKVLAGWWGTRPARPERRGYRPSPGPCPWPFSAGRTGGSIVGVDAAVGQQAASDAGWCPFPGSRPWPCCRRRFRKKLAVFDGPADPGQVLKDHPAAADVGVAHLAVAHLPGGQTHVQAGGGEGGVGICRRRGGPAPGCWPD